MINQLIDLCRLDQDPTKTPGSRAVSHINAQLDILGPADRLLWKSVRGLAETGPPLGELVQLLKRLIAAAPSIPEHSRRRAFLKLVGDTAYDAGVLTKALGTNLGAYVDAISHTNPYRAIELWAQQPEHNVVDGASYYVKAGHLEKAEKILGDKQPSNALVRSFVQAYAARGDVENVKRWVSQCLQNPRNLQWLHHMLAQHRVRIEGLPAAPAPVPIRYSKYPQRVVALIGVASELLAAHLSSMDIEEVDSSWERMLREPTDAHVLAFVEQVASNCALDQEKTAAIMVRLIRLLQQCESRKLMEYMLTDDRFPKPEAKSLFRVLSRADPYDAAVLAEFARDLGCLFTPAGFAAVCQARPPTLLALGEEARKKGLAIGPHHLHAMWQAVEHRDVPEWLFAETKKHCSSSSLLRIALAVLVDKLDLSRIVSLLYEFQVIKKLCVDPRIVAYALAEPESRAKIHVRLPEPNVEPDPAAHESTMEQFRKRFRERARSVKVA